MKRLTSTVGALLLLLCGWAAAQSTPEIQQSSAYLKGQADQVLTQYMTGMMGAHPFEAMFGQASAVATSGLYKVWITISVLIAVMGLAVSISSVQFEESGAITQLRKILGRFVVTTALIASAFTPHIWGLSRVMTSSVSGSYTLGLNSFGGSFNAKLNQTVGSFTDMLGATLVVGTTLALPEGYGALRAGTGALAKTFASGGSRVLAAKESVVAASAGIKAAGTKVVGFVMQRLGGMFLALQYFLSGYGALITAAGWLTVIMLIAVPLGLALLNWGESRVLWTAFGTWIGVMVALMLMPAILVNAIDTALVQPVQSMTYYTAELGLQAQKQKALAKDANQQVQGDMNKMLNQCQDAQNLDPANLDSNPCQKVVNQGALVQFGNWLTGTAAQQVANAVQDIVNNIADSFVSFGVMVFRLMVGVFLAGLLMFGVPVAAISMFSGVAVRK